MLADSEVQAEGQEWAWGCYDAARMAYFVALFLPTFGSPGIRLFGFQAFYFSLIVPLAEHNWSEPVVIILSLAWLANPAFPIALFLFGRHAVGACAMAVIGCALSVPVWSMMRDELTLGYYVWALAMVFLVIAGIMNCWHDKRRNVRRGFEVIAGSTGAGNSVADQNQRRDAGEREV